MTRRHEHHDSLGSLRHLKAVPATEFAEWGNNQPPAEACAPSSAVDTQHLQERERRYLKAVVEKPGKSSSHYTKLAGIGSRHGQRIRKRLVDLGYIRENKINTSSRGRPSIVLQPLEPAIKLMTKRE